MSNSVFREYQRNFRKDVLKGDYKLLLFSNNLIITLLRYLIKKNHIAIRESIIIKGSRVEVILDLSGFEKKNDFRKFKRNIIFREFRDKTI